MAGLAKPRASAHQEQWLTDQQPPPISPASIERADLVSTWQGPAGREIRLVVKQPKEAERPQTITVRAARSDEDAGPLLQSALDAARQSGAHRVALEGAQYKVRLQPRQDAHLMIAGLSDLTIDGRGASILFTGMADGIRIRQSERIRLFNITLGFSSRCSSLGVTRREGDQTLLVVDARYPVDAQTPLHQVTEYDRDKRQWVPGGKRVILPPDSDTPAQLVAPQTYRSKAFARLPVGRTFAIFHSWYQGAVVRIEDEPGPRQAQDITLEKVKIVSGPGMGVLAYGLQRGLALLNSRIQADEQLTGNPLSTNYDALHVLISGGDTLVRNNFFADHGDDAINLSTPQSPIASVEEAGAALTLSKYSRFLRAGQAITLVDKQGQIAGNATITQGPQALGGLLNRIVITPALPEAISGWTIRSLPLQGGRFDITDNRFERFNGHAVLAQQARGRIHHNQVADINRNAIRLLTDTGRWNEGAGAIDIAVTDNVIDGTAIDEIPGVPWAVITAYGGSKNGLTEGLVNSDLLISGNVVRRAQQGCITVANSVRATIKGNLCTDTNLREPRASSIQVERSSQVVVQGNRREGTSTGGVNAKDSQSTRIDAD